MTRLRTLAVVLAASLALVACSDDGYSRDEAIADLTDELGLDEDTAACFVDEIEGGDVALEDAADPDNADDPVVSAALESAATSCLTAEDFGTVLEGADLSQDEIKEGFVAGFVSGGQFDEAQGECVFDSLVDQGVELEQLFGLATGEVDVDSLTEQFQTAALDCGI